MDAPLVIVKFTIWTYWLSVLVLVLYKRLRLGRSSGVVPQHARERLLWWLMTGVLAAWLLLPALAQNNPHRAALGVPGWAHGGVYEALRWSAAILGVGCYAVTAYCWILMGRNWSMAVVPDEPTELVTRGLYAVVRHPIYALSVLLMICTGIVLPTWPMLLAALLHIGLWNIKAGIEESYLAQLHGPAYERYCQSVGRFWPKLHRWRFAASTRSPTAKARSARVS
jgi:protein-S-isoprenylcysteine O-methyltransferase Ste14